MIKKSVVSKLLEYLDNGPIIMPFDMRSACEQKRMISHYCRKGKNPSFVPWLTVRIVDQNNELCNSAKRLTHLVFIGSGHDTFSFLWKFSAVEIPIFITDESLTIINDFCGKDACFLYVEKCYL